jgi:hypothetical protein
MLKRGSCAKELVGSTFALLQKNEAKNVETGVSRIHIKKDTHLTQGLAVLASINHIQHRYSTTVSKGA